MVGGLLEITRAHARLQEHAAELFRALDAGDRERARAVFAAFLAEVEVHVHADVALGYRLLLRHPSPSVRRVAERVLREQEGFPQTFARFATAWRDADAARIGSIAFRDDLETLVSDLLKRIRVEGRLVAMLSSVA